MVLCRPKDNNICDLIAIYPWSMIKGLNDSDMKKKQEEFQTKIEYLVIYTSFASDLPFLIPYCHISLTFKHLSSNVIYLEHK
jgi:hypothetical protein